MTLQSFSPDMDKKYFYVIEISTHQPALKFVYFILDKNKLS